MGNCGISIIDPNQEPTRVRIFNRVTCKKKEIITVQGTAGSQGVQGNRGGDGSPGGAQGIQGLMGVQGYYGVQGSDGVGPQGTIGPQGVQGITGIQGRTGTQGITGIGIQGVQGPIGIQGPTGIQGPFGIQGTQGLNGTASAQGATGSQGIQGLQGVSGGSTLSLANGVDNRVVTATGANAMNAETNVTFDGTQLYINGTVLAVSTMTATNFILSSDERLKTDIESVTPEHLDINYKKFRFKNEMDHVRYGVIAQDILKKYPEFVRNQKTVMSVSYMDIFVKEIVYAKSEIISLKARVAELENKIK